MSDMEPIFVAASCWLLSFLFDVAAFKFVCKSIYTHGNIVVCGIGAVICICAASACFVYGLLNLFSTFIVERS